MKKIINELEVEDFKAWFQMDYFKSDNLLNEDLIGKSGALKFSINRTDHAPPHLHVMNGNQTLAKINLQTYDFSGNTSLKQADRKKAVAWTKAQNQNGELVKKFKTFTEGFTVYYIRNGKNINISKKLLLG